MTNQPSPADPQTTCPKCKGKLTAPGQPCPWCATTNDIQSSPASPARKSWSVIEIAIGVLGILAFVAIPFIPKPHYVVSQEAITARWATNMCVTVGLGLLAAAVILHVRREE